MDENDDADAAKKEAEFPYQDDNGAQETVYPLRGLDKLEELDLYDNSLKKVKGLEGLVGLKSVSSELSVLGLPLARADAPPGSPPGRSTSRSTCSALSPPSTTTRPSLSTPTPNWTTST